MPVTPTAAELEAVAASAQFTFEVDLRDGHDVFLVVGTGLSDLDKVLATMDKFPPPKVTLDVGIAFAPGEQSMKKVSIADVQLLRALFLAKYGPIDKLDEYDDQPDTSRTVGTAFPVLHHDIITVTVPLTADLFTITADSKLNVAATATSYNDDMVGGYEPVYGV